MKTWWILLFSLCVSCLLSPAQASPKIEAEKEITATLHQMYEAEKRKDLAFVLAHLSTDFVEVAGDGRIYRREDVEREWANVNLRAYALSDCVFQLFTQGAAYLSCVMTVDAAYKGRPFPGKFRVTTVWTEGPRGWLLRFEQGTIVPETAS
jgi:ketosteroid isomerase-like protein